MFFKTERADARGRIGPSVPNWAATIKTEPHGCWAAHAAVMDSACGGEWRVSRLTGGLLAPLPWAGRGMV